jgi:hypothetical protein
MCLVLRYRRQYFILIVADSDDRFLRQTIGAGGRNVIGALKVSDLFSIYFDVDDNNVYWLEEITDLLRWSRHRWQ